MIPIAAFLGLALVSLPISDRLSTAAFSLEVPSGYSGQARGASISLSHGSGRSTVRIQVTHWGKVPDPRELLRNQWTKQTAGWTVHEPIANSVVDLKDSKILLQSARITLNAQEQFFSAAVLTTPESSYWAEATATDRDKAIKGEVDLLAAIKSVMGPQGKVPGAFGSEPNPPATGPLPPTTPGATVPAKPTEKPAVEPPVETLKAGSLPPLSGQEIVDLDTLSKLAVALQQPERNTLELLTRAAQLCGFTLRRGSGPVTYEPPAEIRLGLVLELAELQAAAILYDRGAAVRFVDWAAGMDLAWNEKSVEPTSLFLVSQLVSKGRHLDSRAARALSHFLGALSMASGRGFLDGSNPEATLDSVQILLLTRWLSELISRAASDSIPPPADSLWATSSVHNAVFSYHSAQQGSADFSSPSFGTSFLNLYKKVSEFYKTNPVIQGGLSIKSNISTLKSILKFLLSYAYLEGEVTIKAPGNPMERRLDGQGGEDRTLEAKFWIDGSKIQDFFKQNQTSIEALAGETVRYMTPTNKVLTGFHEWRIHQPTDNTDNQVIQLKARQFKDISKNKTDGDGVSSIIVTGAPRRKALDRRKTVPYLRNVRIEVTPQVETPNAKQDLWEIFKSASGFYSADKPVGGGGGPGVFLKVMSATFSTLYRMNWAGGKYTTLKVRDFVEANAVAEVEIRYDQELSRHTTDLETSDSKKGELKIEGAIMGLVVASAEGYPPGFDASSLQSLPPDARKRAAAEIEKWRKEQDKPGKERFDVQAIYMGGGSLMASVHNSSSARGWVGGGEGDSGKPYSSSEELKMRVARTLDIPNQDFFVQIEIDKAKGTAFVSVTLTGEATKTRSGTLLDQPTPFDPVKLPHVLLSDLQIEEYPKGRFRCSVKATKTDYGTTIYEGTGRTNLEFGGAPNVQRIGQIGIMWKLEMADNPILANAPAIRTERRAR